nr:MAG: Protein of unknown function (DUF3853) [Bacteriophage sp.]
MMVDISASQLHYLRFLEAHKIKEEPMVYISQNKAFQRFGRANVERWREQGRVRAFQRPQSVEYLMTELLKAAENQQDYM